MNRPANKRSLRNDVDDCLANGLDHVARRLLRMYDHLTTALLELERIKHGRGQ